MMVQRTLHKLGDDAHRPDVEQLIQTQQVLPRETRAHRLQAVDDSLLALRNNLRGRPERVSRPMRAV